jgi:hypothetical protein
MRSIPRAKDKIAGSTNSPLSRADFGTHRALAVLLEMSLCMRQRQGKCNYFLITRWKSLRLGSCRSSLRSTTLLFDEFAQPAVKKASLNVMR